MANGRCLDRLVDAITTAHDGDMQIDSTSVRMLQQAATTKGIADDCLGRSRAGLTTKIHVLVEAQGLPIRLDLTARRKRWADRERAA